MTLELSELLGRARIIDMSYPLSPEFPLFPVYDPVRVVEKFTCARDGFFVNSWAFDEHCGTHVDAPAQAPQAAHARPARQQLDLELAHEFEKLGGELHQDSRWRENEFHEGTVRATGRRLEKKETNWRWFGLKVHARNVRLAADLEMHLLPDGYVGLCRLPGGEVNVCGLFRRASRTPLEDPRALLLGSNNARLRQRLEHAAVAEGSFCAVAGLSLEPTPARPGECCVGDALTMIPPVTGNGMSMAFESASLALDPLVAWSNGTISWRQMQEAIAHAHRDAFSSRLRWAKWLQRFLFSRLFRLLGPSALRSELVWRTLFRHTR